MNRFDSAIESFREAAVFPARWPVALQSLSAELNADGASLIALPTRANRVAVSTSLSPFIHRHFSLPFPDPREQRVFPDAREGFKADHAYFTSREISREPYYQEFLVPNGFGWNAAASLGPDLVLSLKRGVRRGPFDAAEVQELDRTLPGLRAASRIAALMWRIHFAGQLASFDHIGRGAMLLDETLRLLDMNTALQFGDGIDVKGGVPHATFEPDRPRLQRFLKEAVDPLRGTAGLLRLTRPSGKRPLILEVIACTEALRSLHSRAVALLLVTDLDRPARCDSERLRELFDLTGTEARLAADLAAGRSLQDSAADLNISAAHARQRLKSIFAKTGTRRQAELVALLAQLPSGLGRKPTVESNSSSPSAHCMPGSPGPAREPG